MRMRNGSWWWGALLAAAAGCGSTQSRPQTQASGPPADEHEPGDGSMCQMMSSMKGMQIAASDSSDGVAILFTTTGDVAGLRTHVRQMAAMRTRMASGGMMDDREGMRGDGKGTGGNGMHGGGMGMKGEMHGNGMGMMGKPVPAHASAEDVPGGARLVLTPVDPAQLAALREQTRSHAAMMSKGECPMMESGPAAPTEQKPEAPPPDKDHEQHHPAGT